MTTLRCEDAVVGSGRRGEREHESRDAPAERAEVVPLEGMGALLRARVCAQEAAEARLTGPNAPHRSRHASTLGGDSATLRVAVVEHHMHAWLELAPHGVLEDRACLQHTHTRPNIHAHGWVWLGVGVSETGHNDGARRREAGRLVHACGMHIRRKARGRRKVGSRKQTNTHDRPTFRSEGPTNVHSEAR